MKRNPALKRRGLLQTHELKPIRGVSALLNIPDETLLVLGQQAQNPNTAKEIREWSLEYIIHMQKTQGFYFADKS